MFKLLQQLTWSHGHQKSPDPNTHSTSVTRPKSLHRCMLLPRRASRRCFRRISGARATADSRSASTRWTPVQRCSLSEGRAITSAEQRRESFHGCPLHVIDSLNETLICRVVTNLELLVCLISSSVKCAHASSLRLVKPPKRDPPQKRRPHPRLRPRGLDLRMFATPRLGHRNGLQRLRPPNVSGLPGTLGHKRIHESMRDRLGTEDSINPWGFTLQAGRPKDQT